MFFLRMDALKLFDICLRVLLALDIQKDFQFSSLLLSINFVVNVGVYFSLFHNIISFIFWYFQHP